MESKKLKKLILGIMLILLLSVFAFDIQQAKAEQWKVGVKVGDWAKYDYLLNYTSNDPDPMIHPPPPGFEDVEYVMVLVQNIYDTIITFDGIIRFKNGTETVTVVEVDVAYNETVSMGTPFFVAANLTAGDPLQPFPYSPIINATLFRTYAGMEREVNYIGSTKNTIGPYRYEGSIQMEMYWDRLSGILTEMNQTMTYTNIPEGYVTQLWMYLELIETNIWEPVHTIATVKFSPRVLNLRSRGNWIHAMIKFPKEYDVSDIDLSTIMLDGITAEPTPRTIGGKGLIATFDRQTVIEILRDSQLDRVEIVEFTITGKFKDGTPFSGIGTIKVISVPEHIIPI